MRLHDLRHTAASILAKRVPIKQVQAFLGHEDVQTTLGIYTHILGGDRLETSKAMSGFLEGLKSVLQKCSASGENAGDNVIDIAEYRRKKFAEA